MPLRLSDLINDTRQTTIRIREIEFNIIYRPNAISLETMAELEDIGEDQYDRLTELLCLILVEWDILDDSDERIPVEPETLYQMPWRLLSAIMEGIRHDMAEDADSKNGSSANSAAGSRRGESWANARTGTQRFGRRAT